MLNQSSNKRTSDKPHWLRLLLKVAKVVSAIDEHSRSNGEVKTCSFVMSHGTQKSSIALTTFATLSNKRNQ